MLTGFSNSVTESMRDRAVFPHCEGTGIEKRRSVKTICCPLRRSAERYKKSDEEEYAARQGLVRVYKMLSKRLMSLTLATTPSILPAYQRHTTQRLDAC
jgi:hypothetical protein